MKYEPEHDPWHQMHNNRLKTTIDYPDYVPTRIPNSQDIKNPIRTPIDNKDRPCLHPGHSFPSNLYIPQGQSYTHTCPGCGETHTVHNNLYYCARSLN